MDRDSAYTILPGSLANPTIFVRPASPALPFEFPFMWDNDMNCGMETMDVIPPSATSQHVSVRHVVGLLWMCGLNASKDVYVKLSHVKEQHMVPHTPSLLDGGANICLTGVVSFWMLNRLIHYPSLSRPWGGRYP